ncbi:MAG: hypothetical protein ACT4NY_17680 [Pseudonocardiales bacterium]
MHAPRRTLAATLLAFLTLALTACGSTDQPTAGQTTAVAEPPTGPVVVASTTWAGAFAKAAGAENVTVVAPASVPHPPDYDPKPSDLAAVASADYVLYAPFDSFAPRLRDAAGGDGQTVEVNLENTPGAIRSEVTRLGELFGTSARATQWLTTFDQRYAELSAQAKTVVPQPAPTAVSHLFMGYWAEFAGLSVAGTFGPEPVTPGKLAELTALAPGVVLANAHLPNNPDIPGASIVELISFPGSDLDLLTVFEENTTRLIAAFRT